MTISQEAVELREAYGYAIRFLKAFCENHSLRQVKPLPTLSGVLTQIDNATTALRPAPSQSDEERAQSIIEDVWDNVDGEAAKQVLIRALAEATLAGAAAEREAWNPVYKLVLDQRDKLVSELAAKDREIAALRAIAKAYEQWEAELIMEGDWRNEMPTLTQPLYDRMMEIQAMRNAALSASPAPDPAEAMRAKTYADGVSDALQEAKSRHPGFKQLHKAIAALKGNGEGL